MDTKEKLAKALATESAARKELADLQARLGKIEKEKTAISMESALGLIAGAADSCEKGDAKATLSFLQQATAAVRSAVPSAKGGKGTGAIESRVAGTQAQVTMGRMTQSEADSRISAIRAGTR